MMADARARFLLAGPGQSEHDTFNWVGAGWPFSEAEIVRLKSYIIPDEEIDATLAKNQRYGG